MPRNMSDDTVETFEVEAAAPAAPEAAAEKKPYGQNVGDIVDANEAQGGRYEAVGAGKLRRVE